LPEVTLALPAGERVTFRRVGAIIIHANIPAARDPLFAAMIRLVKYDHGSIAGGLKSIPLAQLHRRWCIMVESAVEPELLLPSQFFH